MKIGWGMDLRFLRSNAYGYSLANMRHKSSMEDAGVEWVAMDSPETDIVFWFCHPAYYKPVAGKKNILMTVYESFELPWQFQPAFDHPDTYALAAPSMFCVKTFRRYTDKPVYWIPHGVDVERYQHIDRKWTPPSQLYASNGQPKKGQPFTWLWVGAPNPRKGYDFITDLWGVIGASEYAFFRDRNLRLIIKTTGTIEEDELAKMKEAGVKVIKEEWGGFVFREDWTDRQGNTRLGNMYLDTRNLPWEKLYSLYKQAHGFVYPTRGEGFGFTLAEALATGLPSVATAWSGHLDFAHDDGCDLVPYDLRLMDVQVIKDHPNGKRFVSGKTSHTGAAVIPEKFAEAMIKVMNNYPAALAQAKRGGDFIRKEFTWEKSAQVALSVLADVHNAGGQAAA